MPRFVLLYHCCPPDYERASHWDLMFEADDVLRTWALQQLPKAWNAVHLRTVSLDANCPALNEAEIVVAEPLRDHRLDYLHLEGPLSGNRGTVMRVAEGMYSNDSETDDCWRVTLEGTELSGSVWLSRTNSESLQWMLTYEPIT